ncbi:MAG: sensor histidine kinase [Firmicutes bacterium]|nr:sensor histidine kinase [Bacillota bacterium]
MKKYPKPRSLRFRLMLSFLLFAGSLMLLLWTLQVLFLQNYYEAMKTREVIQAADSIVQEYGDLDLSKLQEFSYKTDMYIHLETEGGLLIYTTSDTSPRPSTFASVSDLAQIRTLLEASPGGSVSYTVQTRHGIDTLVYGRLIHDSNLGKVYLSIFAPLSPVESTIEILRDQLIIVTFISLAVAFIIAFVLSTRLSDPLTRITRTAGQLAKGKYGVTFEGSGYSEVAQLADTLTHTSRELARTDELKKDLLANVSHDLRTPLTMIKSYAEMVRDLSGNNPVKREEHLNVIIDEADRLNLLVSDLLTLSKMQSGNTALEWGSFDLKEAAVSALRPFELLQEQDGFRISLETEGEDFTVWGDYGRIRQVLSNLLTNAVRYSGDNKAVTLRLCSDANGVRCEVQDRGIGIPTEELSHIWERYYRASSQSGRASGGSGLGLAITKEIFVLHGASYGAESTVGQGSTFWFSLKHKG